MFYHPVTRKPSGPALHFPNQMRGMHGRHRHGRDAQGQNQPLWAEGQLSHSHLP